MVLDPFCGTGTTLVEAKLKGYRAVGVEANPVAHFASSVKLKWDVDPDQLLLYCRQIANVAIDTLKKQNVYDGFYYSGDTTSLGLRTLDKTAYDLLITDSISPLPLHKSLILLEGLRDTNGHPCYRHALLAFANALVTSISNLKFGPEVGVGVKKQDAPVISTWLSEVGKMARDLRNVYGKPFPSSTVYLADSRSIADLTMSANVKAVITSPPYPNEKDYTRITRLESVLLGFINNNSELREFKKKLVRSNTRGVYVADDDDSWVSHLPEVQFLSDEIERRRIELGKTSGFERLYSRVTRLYFGGMARHLKDLQSLLLPGAMLGYVVGDQASYLRIKIPTGQILGKIAQTLGYDLVRTDLFRTRFATATREQLREEVVILRWPG